MKKKYFAGVAMLVAIAGSAQASGFTNGGFETGQTTGWTTGGGYRGNVDNTALVPTDFLPSGAYYGDNGTRGEVISSSYVDPNLGALLGSTVYTGQHAYRAEDTYSGGYGTVISQKVSNYTDSNIYFAWKAVLENGGHEGYESAVMVLTLTDDTTGQLLVSRTYNAGYTGSGVDARFSSENGLFYTPQWQIEQLSIDQANLGHSFTLSLLAADCEPTGHTGYAYLDGFGGIAPAVPEPGTYAMLLAGLGMLGWVKRRKKA
jgi:hypothetical protein